MGGLDCSPGPFPFLLPEPSPLATPSSSASGRGHVRSGSRHRARERSVRVGRWRPGQGSTLRRRALSGEAPRSVAEGVGSRAPRHPYGPARLLRFPVLPRPPAPGSEETRSALSLCLAGCCLLLSLASRPRRCLQRHRIFGHDPLLWPQSSCLRAFVQHPAASSAPASRPRPTRPDGPASQLLTGALGRSPHLPELRCLHA